MKTLDEEINKENKYESITKSNHNNQLEMSLEYSFDIYFKEED
jgi:hypothetical protein